MTLEIPRRQCTATNRDGERCRRYPIAGGNVCIFHGGGTPQAQQAARKRLLGLVEPIIEVFEEIVETWHGTRCETCGRPTGDPGPIIRIGQLALDRSGLGPSATLSLEQASHEPPPCVRWLSTEQLYTIAKWYEDATARMERGEPPVGGHVRLLDEVPASIDGVMFIERAIVDVPTDVVTGEMTEEAEEVENS